MAKSDSTRIDCRCVPGAPRAAAWALSALLAACVSDSTPSPRATVQSVAPAAPAAAAPTSDSTVRYERVSHDALPPTADADWLAQSVVEHLAGHGDGLALYLRGPAREVLEVLDDLRQAVHDLQRTMHEDPPAAFLYWGQASRAVSRRFVLPAGDDLDILRSVDRWQLVDRGAAGATSP